MTENKYNAVPGASSQKPLDEYTVEELENEIKVYENEIKVRSITENNAPDWYSNFLTSWLEKCKDELHNRKPVIKQSPLYAVKVRTKKDTPPRVYEMLWYNEMFIDVYKNNDDLEYISNRQITWKEYITIGLLNPTVEKPEKKEKLETAAVWVQGDLF